ncbi:hypothetical protein V5O48_007996 [Marasmius crinis-equi]|uniref:Protein kinase domain-containing protein n=1 Tax=Marasmius crinis-equi TaxID=585013 RepID=A0ABR3FFJ5_9AGAR
MYRATWCIMIAQSRSASDLLLLSTKLTSFQETKCFTKTYNISRDVRACYQLGLLLLNVRPISEDMAVHRGFDGFFKMINLLEVAKCVLCKEVKDTPVRAEEGNVTEVRDLPQFSNLGRFDYKIADEIEKHLESNFQNVGSVFISIPECALTLLPYRIWPDPSKGHISNYVGKRTNGKEVDILDYLAQVQGVIPVVYDGSFQDRFLTDSCSSGHLLITPWAGNSLPSYTVKSVETAQRITLDLLKILQKVHDHGVAHLNITPEHILIDERYSSHPINLVGFSSAVWDEEDPPVKRGRFNRMAGFAGWRAPEVLSQKPYDPFCADRWSLGRVLASILNESCESTSLQAIV